jgi:hypothetical protein
MNTRADVYVKTGLFTLVVIAVAALLIAVGAKAADRAANEASLGRHSRHNFPSGDFRSGDAFPHFR